MWTRHVNRIAYPPTVSCLVSEVHVGYANWIAHRNGKKHTNKLQKALREGSIYWKTECEVCGVDIEPYRLAREIHERTRLHVRGQGGGDRPQVGEELIG